MGGCIVEGGQELWRLTIKHLDEWIVELRAHTVDGHRSVIGLELYRACTYFWFIAYLLNSTIPDFYPQVVSNDISRCNSSSTLDFMIKQNLNVSVNADTFDRSSNVGGFE